MTEITTLPPIDTTAALELGQEIDSLLGQISAHELRLARSYARLGGLLREVKNQQFWLTFGYDRFSSYLEFVRQKIGRERSQVYAILSVAETLLPLLTEEQLESVGITKAQELRRFVNEGGNLTACFDVEIQNPLSPSLDSKGTVLCLTTVHLMDYAADPKTTASMLRVKINELLHIHEGPRGNWIDFAGFYATSEEKKEIEQFWELGKKLFSKKDEQSEHVWKHDVILAAIRECVGTWVMEDGDGGF